MRWINTDFIDLRPRPKLHWWSRRRYDYIHDFEKPLIFEDVDGTQYQPHGLNDFDFGSVPPFVRVIPGFRPDDWMASFTCHDYSYRTGGYWIRKPDEMGFNFCKLDKLVVDRLLYRMCRAEGAPVAIARLIYRGVRLGSGWIHYGPRVETFQP